MAIRKDNDDKPRNADFVGRVVGDPNNPPETRMLSGWLGAAADKGYQRLYTDPELTNYVDLPSDAILYTEPLRDVQPAGAVLVWIQRDAAVKQGGSAASRAARFLQGQVSRDFSTPEKAGFRCVTEKPCAEPTGFTGLCTKQPDVGGGWPCITALPICQIEPTGFTGKCTKQPWPNPTKYIGCTYYHCPTQDLTHIPWICNIVASGMPGCGVVDPPQGGGDPPAGTKGKASAEAAAAPQTQLPGCGYTKTWGLCDTHFLGCNTAPPKCQVSVQIPCIPPTEMNCVTRDQVCIEAQPQQQFGAPTPMPNCTVVLPTVGCPTRHIGCRFPTFQPLHCVDTVMQAHCQLQQAPHHAMFGAAAAPGPVPIDPSAFDACPTRIHCQTAPPTQFCTQIPEGCPTWCGPNCQSQAPCTPVNCTHAGPDCPSFGFACTIAPPCGDTVVGAICPQTPLPVCANNPNVGGLQTIPNCTLLGCPPAQVGAAGGAQASAICATNIGCTITIFPPCGGAQAMAPNLSNIQCQSHLLGCTQSGLLCGQTQQFECTMFCPPPTSGGFKCPPPSGIRCFDPGQQFQPQQAAARAGGFGVTAWLDCTQFGMHCGQFFTLFSVDCQVVDPWVTRVDPECIRTVMNCPPPTPDCPKTVWQCPPPPFTPLCPPQSRIVVCTIFNPQCGGGGTIVQQFGAPAAAAAQPAAVAGGVHITLLTIPVWQCHSPLPWHCPPRSPLPWLCPPPSPLPWLCPPPSPLPWHCGGPSPFCPVTLPINCPGPSAVDACPTRLCGAGGGLGGDPFAGGGGGGGQFGAAAAQATTVGCPPTNGYVCPTYHLFCPTPGWQCR